jgi:transcriptional regulator with XRE-family HTH domain
MQTGGQIIKAKRESLGLLLRHVAAHVNIDQAILSKIENGVRRPSRENIVKLAEILNLDVQDLMIQFISDKIAYEISEEDFAARALKVAEQKVKYLKLTKNG